METTAVLAWLTLLVGVPLNALAAALLLKQWRAAPHLRVLRERFVVAVAVTFLVLFFGIIFVNNDQTIPPVSVDATKLITRTAMLAVALVVGVGWLWVYRSLSRRPPRQDGEGKVVSPPSGDPA